MLVWIIASLVGGVLAGIFIRSERLSRAAALAQKYGLFVMVFLLGLGLGIDRSVLSNLGEAGLYAAVFAVLCTGTSVLFGLLYARIRGRRKP